mgnify:CR=1 FL=1
MHLVVFQPVSPISSVVLRNYGVWFFSHYSTAAKHLHAKFLVKLTSQRVLICIQIGRLPCMATRSSNLMHDTLTGRDEMIDADDVFNCKCYPRGVNFPRSIIQLLENFWILKCAKIQVFMYTIILAMKNFKGVKW